MGQGFGVPIRFAHLAWLLSLLVMLGSRLASAAPSAHAEPEYRVFEGCPAGVDSFSGQVSRRTPVWRAATRPFDVRLVEVVETASGVLGRVVFEQGGVETTREIHAADCAEALEALALIVAILLDPEADTRPHLMPRAERQPTPVLTQPPPAAPARELYLGVGVGWSALGGLSPNLLHGARLFLEVGRREPGVLLSSVRLSVLRALSGSTFGFGEGSAAFRLDAARLDGCAFRWQLKSASLEPCLGVESGALLATGTHPVRSRSERLAWVAVGGLLRGAVRYEDTLQMEVELGAAVPISRYRFGFSGELPLYETAGIGFRAGVGLGVRFP